jgi:hypothetical protein
MPDPGLKTGCVSAHADAKYGRLREINARRKRNVRLVAPVDNAAVMSQTVGSVRHLVGLPHTLHCFDRSNGVFPASTRGVV